MLPQSCDTMVALPRATRQGQTLFAKNSDRPKEECQPLVQRPRQQHGAGARVGTQFLEVPQAPETYRHVGSRPYWCWGYEHGFNEHQVVIGNEALPSRLPRAQDPKLVGMELIRLGLERGRTAAEAVQVMTALIERYGQGCFRNDAGVRTYDNGFIVADPREAYVLEAAGHEWVVRQVDSTVGISNVRSLAGDWTALSATAEQRAVQQGWWQPAAGKRFDFAAAYTDPAAPQPLPALGRRARSCAVLGREQSGIDVRTMMAVLRDHSDGADPLEPPSDAVPDHVSICMHYSQTRGGNTAASLVADLCADGTRLPVYWCSFYSPCLGVFFPVFVEGDLPPVLAAGGAEPSDASPWWQFRLLEQATRADPGGRALARRTWRALEEEFLDGAYRVATEARRLQQDGKAEVAAAVATRYMAANVERVLAAARELRLALEGTASGSQAPLVAVPGG